MPVFQFVVRLHVSELQNAGAQSLGGLLLCVADLMINYIVCVVHPKEKDKGNVAPFGC